MTAVTEAINEIQPVKPKGWLSSNFSNIVYATVIIFSVVTWFLHLESAVAVQGNQISNIQDVMKQDKAFTDKRLDSIENKQDQILYLLINKNSKSK